MCEITGLIDGENSAELRGEAGSAPKVEALIYSDMPSKNMYSRHNVEPVERDDAINDKKASLLMMNFTAEEVEFAMAKLGEDFAVTEVVDFISAVQMASADDVPEVKDEDVNTETLFGTMDKTLLLLEIGSSEQEISAAIEKYGLKFPCQSILSLPIELAHGSKQNRIHSNQAVQAPWKKAPWP